eukprot:GHRR01021151.1.p2 GENE.GHRR01021151.1~~GHRR01021151.1.p2  ORF type:complete len:104 (+),score=0.93 GHRR01021151.1:219-530(+)
MISSILPLLHAHAHACLLMTSTISMTRVIPPLCLSYFGRCITSTWNERGTAVILKGMPQSDEFSLLTWLVYFSWSQLVPHTGGNVTGLVTEQALDPAFQKGLV